MAAQVSLTGIAKTQSFGGRIQRSSRRLPESMARVLAHVFAGAETEAGLKSISYGQTDGTVSAKGDGGHDLTDGLYAGSENDDGFVHLFAAERYVLTVQRQGAKASRAYNEALAAIKLMSASQVGRLHVAILFAHYGPRRPDMRTEFGEVGTVVEHTPTVLARRELLAKRLGDERVEAAELQAVVAVGHGEYALQELIAAEEAARAALARSRAALAKTCNLYAKAVDDLTREKASNGKRVDRLTQDVERRAALATVRHASIERRQVAVDEARAKRLAFPVDCGKQGPERTARPAREVATAAIREGANREVSAAAALRDIMRAATPSVQKLSSLVVRLKVEGDEVLTRAEDAYRAALHGETT